MKLKIIREETETTPKILSFFCKGCGEDHQIPVKTARAVEYATWGWNGSMDKPTFTPSIHVRSGHYAPHYNKENDECWCTYNKEHADNPARFKCYSCHTFVTDGNIQYLPDCSHELAGQTIPLPETTEW